jgi:serine/threonine protein kinase
MNAALPGHPSSDRLVAFVAGRLDEAASLEIETHLNSCGTCWQVLESLAEGSLELLLRVSVRDASSSIPETASEVKPTPKDSDTPESPETKDAEHVAPPWMPELPKELVDHPRYTVLGLLGTGGMGAVYRAQHKLMDRIVALKVIRRKVFGSAGDNERFSREVKAAARLHHPNIVTAYDAEHVGDLHFLVMELVEGVNLAKVVAERGPLHVPVACDYVRQAALGLQHAWERGTVHRDIKPQNLMLTPHGHIKILDFGLARFLREAAAAEEEGGAGSAVSPTMPSTLYSAPDALTEAGAVMGTPDFMAPEQAHDARTADIRADIYSLGCTLYYLLSGRAPFFAETLHHKIASHRDSSPPPLSDLRADVASSLLQVLDRMMAKRPEDRYQTPSEVVAALGAPEADKKPQPTVYQLIQRIGVGNLGEVWRAEAPGGIKVAVKIFHRPVGSDADQHEKRALDHIKNLRHPFLLSTHAYWISADGRLHVAMELAERTLRDRLKEYLGRGLSGIPPLELLGLMKQAAQALDYIHGEGLYHRDIKPDNILLSTGFALVGDFSLARSQDTLFFEEGAAGTLAYMGPECFSGHVVKQSDQYSLAITYHELRTNRRPYPRRASLYDAMIDKVEGTPDLAPLEGAERNVLLRALAKKPEDRFLTCVAFVDALESAFQFKPAALPPPAAPDSSLQPVSAGRLGVQPVPPQVGDHYTLRGGRHPGDATDTQLTRSRRRTSRLSKSWLNKLWRLLKQQQSVERPVPPLGWRDQGRRGPAATVQMMLPDKEKLGGGSDVVPHGPTGTEQTLEQERPRPLPTGVSRRRPHGCAISAAVTFTAILIGVIVWTNMPQTADRPLTQASYELVAPEALTLKTGQSRTIQVGVKRNKFDGPIWLSSRFSPNGIIVSGKCEPGSVSAEVTLIALPNAPVGESTLTLRAEAEGLESHEAAWTVTILAVVVPPPMRQTGELLATGMKEKIDQLGRGEKYEAVLKECERAAGLLGDQTPGWVLACWAECLIETSDSGKKPLENLRIARELAFGPRVIPEAGAYGHYVQALVLGMEKNFAKSFESLNNSLTGKEEEWFKNPRRHETAAYVCYSAASQFASDKEWKRACDALQQGIALKPNAARLAPLGKSFASWAASPGHERDAEELLESVGQAVEAAWRDDDKDTDLAYWSGRMHWIAWKKSANPQEKKEAFQRFAAALVLSPPLKNVSVEEDKPYARVKGLITQGSGGPTNADLQELLAIAIPKNVDQRNPRHWDLLYRRATLTADMLLGMCEKDNQGRNGYVLRADGSKVEAKKLLLDLLRYASELIANNKNPVELLGEGHVFAASAIYVGLKNSLLEGEMYGKEESAHWLALGELLQDAKTFEVWPRARNYALRVAATLDMYASLASGDEKTRLLEKAKKIRENHKKLPPGTATDPG